MTEETARERILQTATTLFAQRAFGDVSVRDIASSAEVNVSMISYYFGGKEGLRAAVLEQQLQKIDEVVVKVESASSSEGALGLFVRSLVEIHSVNPLISGLLHQEMAHPTGVLSEKVAPRVLRVANALGRVMEKAVREGTFRSDIPPSLMVYALAAMVNYVFLLRPLVDKLLPGLSEGHEAFGAGILSIFLQGVENNDRA